MTTCSVIVRDAAREGNLLAISASPTTAELAEWLRLLNRLVMSVLGNEAGENLTTIDLARAPTPLPLNYRVGCTLSGARTVTLSKYPQDGARAGVVDIGGNFATSNLTVDGNGWLIEGADSVVVNTNGISREWFFRADLGCWKRVSTLVGSDEMPFPSDFDDMFITLLAMRLAPRNSASISNETAEALKRARGQFAARYRQKITTPADGGVRRLSVPTIPQGSGNFGAYDEGYLLGYGG